MRIFIQNISSRRFFAGNTQWCEDPNEAYAFPNAVAALNFAAVHPDRNHLMMHFETPQPFSGSIVKATERARKNKSNLYWKGPGQPSSEIRELQPMASQK